MKILTRLPITAFLCGLTITVYAIEDQNDLPHDCRSSTSTVALLDCLQNHQDLLQAILSYQELLSQIDKIKTDRTEAKFIPPAPEPEKDNALVRAKWFDENLQVFAIIGNPESLTAYARLGDHEYRLQEGDVIRLARVSNVHPRGIDLSISGVELSIGLSGLPVKSD